LVKKYSNYKLNRKKNKMIVKILGTGCKKCQTLEAKVRDLVAVNNIDAEVEKITDIQEMMKYGIMMTPGLIINEKVKSFGIIPKDDQIISWLKEV
jgi:small redox-active disulfide protein 2